MKKMKNKSLLALVLVALLLTVAVGSTLAFLADKTEQIANTFTPTKVEVSASEFKVTSGSGSDVVDAYVRAAVLVNWKDKDGNVFGEPPVEGTDYTLKKNSDDWTEAASGYYYYNQKLPRNTTVDGPVTEITKKSNTPMSGFDMVVDIHVQAIQAEGMGATSAQDAFAKAATGN